MGIAYDASHSQIVLFGGSYTATSDTWIWDGSDWSQSMPTHAPSRRFAMGMAYDQAHGQVVLFGGGNGKYLGDTWTWDGTDWQVPFRAVIVLNPKSGPPGTAVLVSGWSFGGSIRVTLGFIDSMHGSITLDRPKTDSSGAFSVLVTIPNTATPGKQHITAKGFRSGQVAKRTFIVT
jgi:hypothetical protein